MTERKPSLSTERRGYDGGQAWKSGLMASSVGAVLLGWAMLGRMEAASTTSAAQIVSPEPRVIYVQAVIPNDFAAGTQQNVAQQVQPASPNDGQVVQTAQVAESAAAPAETQIVLPPMPERPVFQQPVTQTRGS